MTILFALAITACYLIGGQIEKGVRRYGVPVLSAILAGVRSKKEKWRAAVLLAMIGVLSLGYGESSWLRNLCKGNDTLTRAVYAFLLAAVFTLAGCSVNVCFPVLVVAWQVRAGKLFSIGKFDVLIEDIARAAAIFVCTYSIGG